MFKKLTASFKTKASSKDSEKTKEEEKLPEVTILDSDLMARPLKSQPAVAKPVHFQEFKKTAPVSMKRKGLPMKKSVGESIGASITASFHKGQNKFDPQSKEFYDEDVQEHVDALQ